MIKKIFMRYYIRKKGEKITPPDEKTFQEILKGKDGGVIFGNPANDTL